MRVLRGFRLTRGRASRPALDRATTRNRRARAAVLSGVAAAVAGLLGLAVQVETTRPGWRDPDGGPRLQELRDIVRWRDRADPGRPLVVAVGSSRVQMGLSPLHLGLDHADPAVPLVYNCGHTGYDPVGQLLTVRRLLDAGVTPDYLLVEVMPLTQTRAVPPPSVVAPTPLGYADLARLAPYVENPAGLRREWAAARVRSWHTLRFSLLTQWGAEEWVPPRLRQYPYRPGQGGWSPFDIPPATDAQRATWLAAARETYRECFADPRVAGPQDRAYHETLGLCRERGVRAALLLLPESPAFRACYPPRSRPLIRGYAAALAGTYGVPVFDAWDWSDDEADFPDGHHLLVPAAARFSKRFGAEHLLPWVRGK